jgi:ABC-type multidrug transport system fused ATPase/permease subunit
VQEYWQGACVSREAIQRFLDRPTMQRDADPVPLEAGPGRLEIEALTLEGAIVDVDAVVEAGSTVAIVGPNGAGKSTLLALVARMVDPDSGTVRLDGQDLATASIEDVRDAIGFVAADLPLLRGSLRRNLTYRQPKADDGEIADIATRCGLDGLIGRLDEGYESRIAEGGRDLSSGERQRVLLARALLGHPPVLLLDEADANLDPATTGLVDRVLREYDGTTLIVTHRHQRLASADAVWFIDDGHLVESGPPDVLLDGDGPTARFFGSVPPASTSPEPSVDAGH